MVVGVERAYVGLAVAAALEAYPREEFARIVW
ncbi:hypothetical protein ABH929_001790 [Curtobacterium sp. AB7]